MKGNPGFPGQVLGTSRGIGADVQRGERSSLRAGGSQQIASTPPAR